MLKHHGGIIYTRSCQSLCVKVAGALQAKAWAAEGAVGDGPWGSAEQDSELERYVQLEEEVQLYAVEVECAAMHS